MEPDQVPKDQQQVLWGVAERLGPELSEDESEQLYNLLLMYLDVFASCNTDLGRTTKLEHEIHTGQFPPHRQADQHIPPQRRKEVRRQCFAVM